MALHLQANHLGKAQMQRADAGKEIQQEGVPTNSTIHSSNIKSSALALDREGDRDGEKIQGVWNNHIDQPYNPFQSDFFRRFGGLYDGSSRVTPGLQGYIAEQGLELHNQVIGGTPLAVDDQIGDRGSCGETEYDRIGSDEEITKAGEHSTCGTPSNTPKRPQLQNNSEEEDDDGRVAEEEEERDDDEQMDLEKEEEGSPASDHSQSHAKQLQDDSSLTLMSNAGLAASSTTMKPLSLVPQAQNQTLMLDKQWQQGLGLLSSEGASGLLKADPQAHLEQQMTMLSVLRAYSNDSTPTFNGLGGGSGGSIMGGVKRSDGTAHLWLGEEDQPMIHDPALTLESNQPNNDLNHPNNHNLGEPKGLDAHAGNKD